MPTLKLRIGLPSKRTMGSICICGALASISGLAYMRWRLEDRVRQTEFYQLAIQQLRQHSGAVGLLGEPIKESGFNLSNEKNRCDEDKAQLQFHVQGPKDRGTVYFWASNNQKQGWLIDRLELETRQNPNTRYLLKKPRTTRWSAVMVIRIPLMPSPPRKPSSRRRRSSHRSRWKWKIRSRSRQSISTPVFRTILRNNCISSRVRSQCLTFIRRRADEIGATLRKSFSIWP